MASNRVDPVYRRIIIGSTDKRESICSPRGTEYAFVRLCHLMIAVAAQSNVSVVLDAPVCPEPAAEQLKGGFE
jgi:hypothetical protein